MKGLMKRLTCNEDGQALVLFVLLLVVLIGIAALVIDVGTAHAAKAKMQSAADAAALAGAQKLPDDKAAAEIAATTYAVQNEVDESKTDVTTSYQGDPNMIEVFCSKDVPFSLANVLGLGGTSVTARAVAKKMQTAGGPFDYAVFSNDPKSDLQITGKGKYVLGNVHSNSGIRMSGGKSKVEGIATAVSKITISGARKEIDVCRAPDIAITGASKGKIKEDQKTVAKIEMPDLSDIIEAEARNAGQVYEGKKTYTKSDINFNTDSAIYIVGDLHLSGGGFQHKGAILVTGDIHLSGQVKSILGDSICLYSKDGDIKITGKGSYLKGILYAPNGTIHMTGDAEIVEGRIIANSIKFTGNGHQIISDPKDLESLPGSGGIKLVE
ncbi:MAG: hypothetical protein GX352_02215 [Clostridiales bacterium]|nr:hypothetical protein [Clostridiales bacterium]